MPDTEKEELAKWYLETIGYDPFVDSPDITVEEVRRIKADYLKEDDEAKA